MNAIKYRWLAVCAVLALCGCANDRVIFVTKTAIGIDVDSTPATASIAFDRVDGYIAPRYDNGAIPPVISVIQSDLAVFSPKIKQVYATGKAAKNIVETGPVTVENIPLAGSRAVMFFGTSTTTGLKVDFASTGVPSLSLGYKRKEASVIPLGTAKDKDGNSIDTYPSVLATVDMRTTTASLDATSLGMTQFFATGAAAEILAGREDIRENLKQTARILTAPLMVVLPVAAEVQVEREKIADYVKGGALNANQRDTLAASLGVQPGDQATIGMLSKLAGATTVDQVNVFKQKIKIFFGKDL